MRKTANLDRYLQKSSRFYHIREKNSWTPPFSFCFLTKLNIFMFLFIGQKVDADNDRTATLSHFAQLYIICYKLELDNDNRQGYFYNTRQPITDNVDQ
jgi:hypothetical protein